MRMSAIVSVQIVGTLFTGFEVFCKLTWYATGDFLFHAPPFAFMLLEFITYQCSVRIVIVQLLNQNGLPSSGVKQQALVVWKEP